MSVSRSIKRQKKRNKAIERSRKRENSLLARFIKFLAGGRKGVKR